MAGPGDDYRPTSERVSVEHFTATEAGYLIYLFHAATYRFAEPYVHGRSVLDMGCGTGYGAHRLAGGASRVVGVDISADAVAYACEHYQRPNLSFARIEPIETADLPFVDGSFDVVTSFQVIEHIADTDRYLNEIARVLAPGGVFLCATPDRSTRLFRGQRPWNAYHLFELTADELEARLRRHFASVELHQMTAPPDVLAGELRRYRRVRLAAWPFTFPGAPEGWRRAGLGLLKRLEAGRTTHAADAPDGSARGPADYGYDETAITIAPGASPSVNLVAVARRAR